MLPEFADPGRVKYGMSKRSKIQKLPKPVVAAINKLLDDGQTLEQIVGQLRDEFSVEVSRSGLGRYKQNLDNVRSSIRDAREMANAIGREVQGDAGKLVQVLSESVGALILKSNLQLMKGDDDTPISTKQISELSQALKNVQTAFKSSVEMEDQVRKRIEREVREQAAKAVSEGARQMGLTKENAGILNALALGVNSDG